MSQILQDISRPYVALEYKRFIAARHTHNAITRK